MDAFHRRQFIVINNQLDCHAFVVVLSGRFLATTFVRCKRDVDKIFHLIHPSSSRSVLKIFIKINLTALRSGTTIGNDDDPTYSLGSTAAANVTGHPY